jgi:mRNA interferase MazF
VSFAEDLGDEERKAQPGVIVSNDSFNERGSHIQVVPLSTRVGRLYPFEAKVTIVGREAKAMVDQITTVSKERLTGRLGLLSPNEMRAVDLAIRIQLGLAA